MINARRTTVAVIVAATALAAASVLTVAAADGAFDHSRNSSRATSCVVPALAGTVVHATLINMGGPAMMNAPAGSMTGMMRLTLDRSTVAHGQVSLLAVNAGDINHELVVLPIPTGQAVGTRVSGADAKIVEVGSLGEASNTCTAGSGNGIAPGGSSWLTMTLPPGRYELVCNLPGHYAAGMYAQLTVT